MRLNPIEPLPNQNSIYRSVSPWELVDFQQTGIVTGRGNWFSGDPRTNLVFFGESLKEVVHHGEDWRRYLESSQEFQEALILKTKFFDLATDLREAAKKQPRWTKPFYVRYDLASKCENLGGKFQDLVFEKMGRILDKWSAERKRLKYTSYILEFTNVPDGTRYTGRESLTKPSEVSFPRNAVTDQYLSRVHLLNNDAVVGSIESAEFSSFKIELPKLSLATLNSLVRSTHKYGGKYHDLLVTSQPLLS